jgi:hypothetical protein
MNEKNPYEKRWNWWYSAIADLMIAHPEWTKDEIATHLKKHPGTIYLITGTDLFQAHLAERKRQWHEVHDQALLQRLGKVALQGLDVLSTQIEKKKDIVPIQQMAGITMDALDRLGYSPQKGPSVVVNNNQNNLNVQPAASLDALEEARKAMRLLEQKRAENPLSAIQKQNEADALLADFTNEEPDGPLCLEGEATEVTSS